MKDKSEFGNKDKKETERKLSEAEQRRFEKFEALSKKMEEQGFKWVELTVSIVKANVFAIALLIPLLVIGFGLLIYFHRDGLAIRTVGMLTSLLALAALVVAHEAIHGLSWAPFAENGLKDIEFGFMKQYLTPYCTCLTPLTKGQYIFGALMPMIVLGIIPMIWGIIAGSLYIEFIGIVMTNSAAGDILIVRNILRYKTDAETVVYIDHPTQAGGVIFER